METLAIETGREPVYSIDQPPGWVTRIEFDPAAVAPRPESPRFYPLVDYQLRIEDGAFHDYRRTVEKINDSSRIEDASLYLYDLHAEREHMVLHAFDIIRDGRRLPALEAADIDVYRREKRLESHITDRMLTLSVALDDLRVGDLLDIETTLIQFATDHPLHAKYLCRTWWLDWSFPVLRERIRVLDRSGGAFVLHQHRIEDGTPVDDFDEFGAGGEFMRAYTDLEPKQIADTAPDWWWSDFLQITSRADWPQISRYLHRYYSEAGALGGALDIARIDRIELDGDSRGDALRLIRFVQNEIRYRGDHQGIYTHTPKPPQRVLDRGAGDCKDKSGLLVALLAAIGIEANLALVNTSYGKGLDRFRPSAYLFDHMIVRVVVDGESHYFDPTAQKQAGDFEHAAQPDLGFALNLTARGEDLARLPYTRARTVFEKKHLFDLREAERGRGELTITRGYHAHRADNARYYFAANEARTIRADYLEQARAETGLELDPIDPVSVVEDDTAANTLVTRESFAISGLDREDEPIRLGSDFHVDFPLPSDARFPLQIEADGAQTHDIEVRYRHRPRFATEAENIVNSHFRYRDEVRSDGRTLHISNRVIPYRELVERGDIDAYRDDAERLRARATNVFPRDVDDPWLARSKWAAAVLLALALLAQLLG